MTPNPERPQIHLKIERRSSHPWIFQKMVEKPVKRPPPGTVVDILDRSGQWVGRGFYNGHSRITLRVLTSRQDEEIDAAWFTKKIERAIGLRRDMLKLDEVTDAYRLVHSEGDDLSGLVVDRFGDTIVVEYFSAGMFKQRDLILQVLRGHYPNAKFYWFAEEHVGKQESFDCRSPEPPAPGVITEHGVRFRVAPGSKHKTGFFVDQRDNRRFLASFCEGKRVLDLCCNSGGFGVYAKSLGKAEEVTGVDLDEQAIAMAQQNANLNQARIKFVQADMFAYIRDVLQHGQRWDVVILDPAKMTRDRESVDLALKKYCDMNRLAMQAVAPGGILLTCSCTGLVSEEAFLETVRRAAYQAGRTAQILKVSGAGGDHPYQAHVQESRYLKAVWCRMSHETSPLPTPSQIRFPERNDAPSRDDAVDDRD
jgi:23S rRNA (cytosine1962-C5)-methyltransferase